ncbi:MAG: hypothetical protein NT121_01745, partial [Chloroflexi bacterium]|nr:hypothetical protein [Chloroflexota bacterium]
MEPPEKSITLIVLVTLLQEVVFSRRNSGQKSAESLTSVPGGSEQKKKKMLRTHRVSNLAVLLCSWKPALPSFWLSDSGEYVARWLSQQMRLP